MFTAGCLSPLAWFAVFFLLAFLDPGLAFIGATVAGFAVLAWSNSEKQRLKPLHDAALLRMRDGYYCYRDDVAFYGEDRRALRPEEFAERAFADYRAKLPFAGRTKVGGD